MATVIKFLFVAAAAIVAVIVLRPRPAFVIHVRGGKVSVARGKLSRKFLEDCQHLISECNIQHATSRPRATSDFAISGDFTGRTRHISTVSANPLYDSSTDIYHLTKR
ncbi:MAG: DUF3634 family protein [Planctomycetota bacterium]|jgi:hypothetical protein